MIFFLPRLVYNIFNYIIPQAHLLCTVFDLILLDGSSGIVFGISKMFLQFKQKYHL